MAGNASIPRSCRRSAGSRYYAERLPAVEINNTFYRLPKASVLAGWAEQVPDDFRFAIKASRRITHIKRLQDADDETNYLIERSARSARSSARCSSSCRRT